MGIEHEFLRELKRIFNEKPHGYQAKLCRLLKIKPSTFSNMVSGRRGMNEDDRIAIAKAVGMDYEGLRLKYLSRPYSMRDLGNSSVANTNANEVGFVQVSIGTEEDGQQGRKAMLSDLEYEVLTLFRRYGNPTLLDRCLRQLREAEAIFG